MTDEKAWDNGLHLVIANRTAVKQSTGTASLAYAPWIAAPCGLAMTDEKAWDNGLHLVIANRTAVKQSIDTA